MFEIEYKGANCVVISTKKTKIVIDPKLSVVGLKDVAISDGAVELATEGRFSLDNIKADVVIDSPGEYGVADVDIKGIAAIRHIDRDDEPKASTIYKIDTDDSRIGIFGNISSKLSDDQLEDIGLLDVLILPVGGGGYTLDFQEASSLVKSINPKIVVPIHYADDAIKYEVPQDDLQLFIKEIGEPIDRTVKFKYKPQVFSGQQVTALVQVVRS